jgi:hypothetical protein
LELFREDGRADAPARPRPANDAEVVYQFKITLLGVQPPVWRTVQVRGCSLAQLHACIQAAMGWGNCHSHLFDVDGSRYGAPTPLDASLGFEIRDESQTPLSQIIPESGRFYRFYYDYDMGDGWRHEVCFEGYPPLEKDRSYPACLAGERACPPEDIGGPWGYREYLEALAQPTHPRHAEQLAKRGPFDAEAFDANRAAEAMRGAV